MVNLLYTEILKLKGSNMFWVSIVGAVVAPFMTFIAYVMEKLKMPHVSIKFSKLFSDCNFYVILLIGILLYGLIAAYLFNREYVEDTLKNLLTIPISRTNLVVSKLVLLLIWIMALTIISWVMTLILGLIGPFEDLNNTVLITSFKEYIIGGGLLFLLSTPIIFVTLLFKDYVPTIAFTIAITMVNVLISNSEYSVLHPWSATVAIATNVFRPEYPPIYSYISVFATSLIGVIATITYFKKVDIH
ncbi:ABC transporter permease [Clostridium faecium]|uniref:ABC transporter permease n=1 Tax=Clostridium faecium TaxID=2762223 RepID=A0ABR8YVL8_9CLOT|nr:ABC transporter permease [Clostridium faecium]MBD8048299.1 ABC transporter permease [Clostridium faecium]